MAKSKIDLRTELRTMKFEVDLLQRVPCTEEENRAYRRYIEEGDELPRGVFRAKNENGKEGGDVFYTVFESDLTERETYEFLLLKKLKAIKELKGAVAVFGSAISALLLIILVFLVGNF